MTSMVLLLLTVSQHSSGLSCMFMFFTCLRFRSDSDSEGENPEKKKLQEQLMGEWACTDSVTW